VRHNNVVPNAHFHKKWATGSRGPLKVKVNFSQPAQKKARRLERARKAAAIAPRPVAGLLRPAVHCSSAKYSSKIRLGRGFSLAELKAAGVAPALARTIGIAVDHRRMNKSQESIDRNVARLAEYKTKLVLFPKKGTKAKKGDSAPAATATATQLRGAIMPIVAVEAPLEYMALTDEMKAAAAYGALRVKRNEKKLEGIRKKMKEDKEKEA